MSDLEFHFDFRSPYSYLAHGQLGGLGTEVRYKPMDVLEVMKIVGNVPTTIVCKAKNRYASQDLGRWAQRYGTPLSPNPAMREIDGRRLLRAVLLADKAGQADQATAALFPALWAGDTDLGSAEAVSQVLAAGGVQIPAAQLDDPALDAELTAASEAAAARDVFGAPTFLLGDEMYFGNDRLDFLRDRLATESAQ